MSEKKEKESNTSIECKKFVLAAVKMINNGDRYFFAKFMEDFYELCGKHQRGIIQYISEKYENKKWKELEHDSTEYPVIIKSILFYFSGRDEIGQPSKKELAQCLREYIDSHFFRDAEEGDDSFSTTITEL